MIIVSFWSEPGNRIAFVLCSESSQAWSMWFMNLYLHAEKLDGLFGTVTRKDWRNWETVSSLLIVCSRDTSRGQGLQMLEVHRDLLWGGGRQSGLCSHLLKPPGNLSPRKSPDALLSSSNKPSWSCYLIGLKPRSPGSVRQNWQCLTQGLLDFIVRYCLMLHV